MRKILAAVVALILVVFGFEYIFAGKTPAEVLNGWFGGEEVVAEAPAEPVTEEAAAPAAEEAPAAPEAAAAVEAAATAVTEAATAVVTEATTAVTEAATEAVAAASEAVTEAAPSLEQLLSTMGLTVDSLKALIIASPMSPEDKMALVAEVDAAAADPSLMPALAAKLQAVMPQ